MSALSPNSTNLIYFLPEGAKLPLNDSNHAVNMLRYYFSQTKAHPTTVETAKNYYKRNPNKAIEDSERQGQIWDAKR